jgi:sensor histidine kinase YesM
MTHPLVQSRNLHIYFALWLVIAILHGFVLWFSGGLNWQSALLDALVFNITYSAIALSIWYSCKYISFERSGLAKFFIGHALEALLSALLWLALGYAMLMRFLAVDNLHTTFLEDSFIWRLLIGVLYYYISAAFYYVFIYSVNLNKQLLRESELKTLVKEAELKSLKFQINPHFIFNSLNSINALTMSDPAKAGEMTIKLADFLRYTLSKNERQITTLQEELDAGRLYLDIEKVRFGDRFDYHETVSPACQQAKVPSMLLQPLFENAIKHGVYESLNPVRIHCTCQPNRRFIEIAVVNGFDAESQGRKGEGIGLANIQHRLEMLYNEKGLLQVDRQENRFSVRILIPIQTRS